MNEECGFMSECQSPSTSRASKPKKNWNKLKRAWDYVMVVDYHSLSSSLVTCDFASDFDSHLVSDNMATLHKTNQRSFYVLIF